MLTIPEHIAHGVRHFNRTRKAQALHIVRSAVVIILIALLAEVFLFNVNYFRTANLNTINMNEKLGLTETGAEQYRMTQVDHTLEFTNLNTEVKNIWIDFDYTQPAQEVTLKIQFTDEAHHTYFDSTEYTAGVPEVNVSTLSAESKYINLNTTGLVDNLRIEVVSDDTSYPLLINNVELNAPEPFHFNAVRFLVLAFVLALIYQFRPRSAIYQISVIERPRLSKGVTIVTVALEVVLMSSYLFMGSNLVGVATANYNSGSWDGKSLVNSFEVAGDNAQQYAELAKALAKGNTYLDEEPPEWLQNMDDPYDKGARDELQKETGEKYLFDVAYYNGHYYVYFGLVPELIFYLPYYLATGANFPTAIGVLFACIMFVLGITGLLDRFARYHFRRVSLGLFLLVQIPLVVCSGILYLLKFPTFYSLPIMCALAFSVWGLYLWLRGRTAEHPEGWFLAGSLCMALVAGCRPQLLVLSLVAFPLFWRKYITKRRLFTQRGAREFACLIVPYLLMAIMIGAYNYMRFGSPLNFGANYNLTVNDMTKRGMNIGRLAPAIFAYFLQPPNIVGTFPFIQAVDFDTTYLGQTIKEVTFGGVFACLPVLWVLPFAPRVIKLRTQQRSTHTVAGVVVTLLIGALLVALLDAEMAGILQRYYADFSFMLLSAAVLLVFIANENLKPHTSTTDVALRVFGFLVFMSVLYSLLLCFVPETGWYSDVYAWAYQDIVEAVQFWT